jgi:hypothetical protein
MRQVRETLVTGPHLSWASMRAIKPLLTLAWISLATAGCVPAPGPGLTRGERSLLALDLAHTRRAGTGVRFRPAAMSPAVSVGARVGAWRCVPHVVTTYAAHLELFARQRGIVVPAGIGVSSPRFDGYRVTGGRCVYPLRTIDPTGLIEVGATGVSSPLTLGALFRLWGQALAADRLGSFTGPVSAYVNGRRWTGNPRAIPLRRHVQIVLELGGFIAPHSTYGFPVGL